MKKYEVKVKKSGQREKSDIASSHCVAIRVEFPLVSS
jgi:hypothetical protein